MLGIEDTVFLLFFKVIFQKNFEIFFRPPFKVLVPGFSCSRYRFISSGDKRLICIMYSCKKDIVGRFSSSVFCLGDIF